MNGDPYWMWAKYAGRCTGCGVHFPSGSAIYRYKTGHIYAAKCGCGQQAEADFNALAQDEAIYNGGYA